MSPDDHISYEGDATALALTDPRLAGLLPFKDVSEQQLNEILAHATLRPINLNETFFSEGDCADNFYVLLDGVLRILRSTGDGEQVVILHVAPGQMFGIAKAFDNDTYHATANAASAGLALSWPTESWDRFVRDYPGFSAATRKAVGARVDEMQDKIVEMATLQVEQRIAHAILRLVRQHGKETNEGLEIGFPITRQDISELTGTTLHSVSRYLSKWEKAGIVNSSRRRVVVCRPEELPL